jgi:DNA-binding HxlR family transcriptional regulator
MAKMVLKKHGANPRQGKKTGPTRGKAVRGSRTGRPIMVLLDLLGRRWTLRILWELREQSLTSRALREACDDASPTVIQSRVAEMREAGWLDLNPAGGYGLTASGRELLATLTPLHQFAERWSQRETTAAITPPPR